MINGNALSGVLMGMAVPGSGLSDAEVQELQHHRGKISVDITLVLIYTGITLLELYSIEKEDVDEKYIYIRKGRTMRSRRNILIHPFVKESFEKLVSVKLL